MPFDPVNYVASERRAMPMSGYRRRKRGDAHTDFIQELDPRPIDTLTFEQLQRFWAHPVRAFFQQRLQVNFRSEESEIPDAEPFTLEGLERYQLNLQLLNALVEEEDATNFTAATVLRGSCPMARLARSSGRRSARR
jgi:exodeoxyribonuclease V gamma subunit